KQADEASAGTDDPSTTTDEGDADGLGAESPPAADQESADQESADDASPTAADVIPPPAGEAAVADGALPVAGVEGALPVAGVEGALPVAGADGVLPVDGADAGPDFGALDDDLAVIETDLLEPFDELVVESPAAVELPPVDPIEIDLPTDLDLLGPPLDPGS
ncbi:MAG: hypothetical protein AAGA93_24470, partial [Actinomycetota bacterium]